jgi:hypothetical protein
MKRILVSLCLAASIIPVAPSPALACSCIASTPEEHADNAKIIFTGMSKRVDRTLSELTVRFRVSKIFKGDVPRRVTIVTPSDSAACGCSFKEDTRYTVFGSARGERVETNLCSGTTKGRIDHDEYGLPPGSRP